MVSYPFLYCRDGHTERMDGQLVSIPLFESSKGKRKKTCEGEEEMRDINSHLFAVHH